VYSNRRRTCGKRLQRPRSEPTEQTFAHVCETGGARRTWLVGIDTLRKRYSISAAAHNLSVLMRVLFNMGTPKGLQQFRTDLEEVVSSLYLAWLAVAMWAASWRSAARQPSDSIAPVTYAERLATAG
jgi:transposase